MLLNFRPTILIQMNIFYFVKVLKVIYLFVFSFKEVLCWQGSSRNQIRLNSEFY